MIFAHAGAINTAREDFVVDAILVLIALAHVQVAKQGLAGNSEPVSLERDIPPLEARYLYTEDPELKIGEGHAELNQEAWVLRGTSGRRAILTAPCFTRSVNRSI